MNATTVAVDLAKSVFQLAVADASWRIIETHRLTRAQLERWLPTVLCRWSSWKPAAHSPRTRDFTDGPGNACCIVGRFIKPCVEISRHFL